MISSEVQRTLVKSPPELWAELSDPAALARHLGELGEVRITRVEPEKLVEWEAEGTTGTVAIKPSGWGTKVTLSVSRELAVIDAEESAEAPEDSAVESHGESHEAESPVLPEPEAQTAAPEEPACTEAGAEEPPANCADEQIAVELDLWASQEAEGAETPMITAAERFAHDDPEPLLGGRLLADSVSEGLDLTHEEPVPAEPAAAAAAEPVAAPSEPRRGLLARLFGRRRKQTASDQPAPATEQPIVDTAPPSELPALPPQTIPTGTTSIEVEDARPPAEAPSGEVDLIGEPGPAPVVDEFVPVAVEQEPEPLLAAGQDVVESSSEQPSPEPAAPDLAAELRLVEETASEEVTAVLTGVLDRLGAAHHRPFSRS